MQPVSGPGSSLSGNTPQGAPGSAPAQAEGEKPLTTAQRTTLERLIIRIMATSNSKAPEIWAALRHQLHLPNDAELTAGQFQPAQDALEARLEQAQQSHAGQKLMQQLSELLPQGNNRQAVSDYIRQQYGHTVLSQLTPDQLQEVVDLLQNGRLVIPQPQQSALTDRTLLPAEHNTLNQQITRLAAITGESPSDIWQSLMTMMGLKAGDPIPARHFPLLTQFLQSHVTLSQQSSPTLASVLAALKQPANTSEQQAVEAYCQQHFNALPLSVLTPAQVGAVLHFLFISRLARTQSQHQTPDARLLQPILSPLIATEPVTPADKTTRSRWIMAAAVAAVLVLLWVIL